MRPERLELPTLCSEGRCSIQLSYGRWGIFYGKREAEQPATGGTAGEGPKNLASLDYQHT